MVKVDQEDALCQVFVALGEALAQGTHEHGACFALARGSLHLETDWTEHLPVGTADCTLRVSCRGRTKSTPSEI